MAFYIDAGLIQTAQVRDDGRIDFYGRCAKVGAMDYYEWRDAKLVKIPRNVPASTLFDAASLRTIEHADLLNLHTTDKFSSPDNRDQVIGFTGTMALPEVDKGFLGIFGSIVTRDGIDAYNAGRRELSPEYLCDIVMVDGVETQINRKYKGVAIVDEARGGHDVKIKDSALPAGWSYSDRGWLDDKEIRQLWLADASPQNLELINRALGTMPKSPPITLPKEIKMTTTKLKIGSHTIEVQDAHSREADNLAAEFASLGQQAKDAAAKLADAEAKLKEMSDAAAANLVLKDKVAELEKVIADHGANLEKEVNQRLVDLSAAGKDCAVFERAFNGTSGKLIATAKDALTKGDIAAYKSAIEAQYKAPAGAYMGLAMAAFESYGKDAAAAAMAPVPTFNLSQMSELGGGAAMSASLTSFTPGLFNNGLVPDDEAHNWRA
jgi:hypothetical protein